MKKYTKDYYKVLHIDGSATYEDIRAAFLTLSKQYHPDKGGTVEKMQLINEAYNILKNPSSRLDYDSWYFFEKTIVKLHILDYDDRYIQKRIYPKHFKYPILDYIDEENNAYAYTIFKNNKKITVFINKLDFFHMFEMYKQVDFTCNVITKRGKAYKTSINYKKFTNNHLMFINLHDDNLYVLDNKNDTYTVINYSEYSAIIKQRDKTTTLFYKFICFALLLFIILITPYALISMYLNNI